MRFESPEFSMDYKWEGQSSQMKFSLALNLVKKSVGSAWIMEFHLRNLNNEDFDVAAIDFGRKMLHNCHKKEQRRSLFCSGLQNQKSVDFKKNMTIKKYCQVKVAEFSERSCFFSGMCCDCSALGIPEVRPFYRNPQQRNCRKPDKIIVQSTLKLKVCKLKTD